MGCTSQGAELKVCDDVPSIIKVRPAGDPNCSADFPGTERAEARPDRNSL